MSFSINDSYNKNTPSWGAGIRFNCQFSKAEVSADTFLAQDINGQRHSVLQMSSAQLQSLFTKLASYVRDAGDVFSRESSARAFFVVAARLAMGENIPQNQEMRISRVLGFMYERVQYCNMESKQRNACAWSAELILTEGNFNGCVEAVKLFKALYDEMSVQLQSASQATYISSFDVSEAIEEKAAGKAYSGAGHAIIAIGDDYYDVTNFTQTNNLQFLKLRVTQNRYDKTVNYGDGQGDVTHTFRLFNPGMLYTEEKGPGGSTDATIQAIQTYFSADNP